MKHFRPASLLPLVLVVLVSGCSQLFKDSEGLEPQFGTALDDYASATVSDPQRKVVYVAGMDSRGSPILETYPPAGGIVFIRRYDQAGTLIWERRLAHYTDSYETYANVNAVKLDASGNVYAAWTVGDLDSVNRGCFAKVSAAGKVLFQRCADDFIADIEIDTAGAVYVCGGEVDDTVLVFQSLRKYSAQGAVEWKRTKLFAIPGSAVGYTDVGDLALTDNGLLFVASAEVGEDSYTPLLIKFDTLGQQLRQHSLPRLAGQVAASATDLYVTSSGSDGRILVQRYDTNGAQVWQRTITPFGSVGVGNLDTDGAGNVYLVGETRPENSDADLFVRKYTASGTLSWTYAPRLRGTNERAFGVTANGSDVYAAGATDGRVNGKNFGGYDAFLLRLGAQGRRVWSR